MKLRKIRSDMKLRGKRVLVRIDANVPLEKGRAVDGPHGRIAKAAVGIDWLVQRGAKVIVMAHLGRPKGKKVSAYSLKPVAKRLGSLIKHKIQVTKSVVGKDVLVAVERMKEGDVLMLENVRFDGREKMNDQAFAHELAQLADVYVNDAFGSSHRPHATLDAITKELPSYAGPLLANEVSILSKLDRQAKHPFVLVMGGLKMETKLPVIEHLSSMVDTVLFGGALSTAFFIAQGHEVGKSVFDEEAVKQAKRLLKVVGDCIELPVDVLVSRSLRKDARCRVASIDGIKPYERIVDIGPETVKRYAEFIAQAKTVVWNGPLGYCEVPAFCSGTRGVARVIADRTGKAMTIVGGGDTGPVVEQMRLADKYTLLSTGGGALLKFLAGDPLPGVVALQSD